MVYGIRKYTPRGTRRYAGKKKTYTGNKYMRYANAGIKALGMAMALKKMINVEYKNVDTSVPTGPLSFTFNDIFTSGLTKGDGPNNYEGRSIKATALQLNMILTANPTATGPTRVRVVIYKDKQCNGALPGSTDIFTVDGVETFRNLANKDRFTIITDKTYTLIPNTDRSSAVMEFYHKCQEHIIFNGNLGTISDLTETSLGFRVISDNYTTPIDFSYERRMRFVDN